MTTLTNPYSLKDSRDIKSAYHFKYRIFGAKLQIALSCEVCLVALRSRAYSELLAKTVYFNKIFKKKEKDNGSRADVVAKKKSLFNDVKEGCSTG